MTILKKIIDNVTKAIFVTLISGVILGELGKFFIGTSFDTIIPSLTNLSNYAKYLMGPAIGLAVAISLESKDIIKYTSLLIGAITAGTFAHGGISIGDPLTAILGSTLIVYIMMKIENDRFFDLLLIPITSLILSLCISYLMLPINEFIGTLGSMINQNIDMAPYILVPVLAIIFSFFMTGPLSSTLLAIIIGIDGRAAFVIMCATSAQMVSYTVMSLKDNGIINSLVILFGTSKLQFSNSLKNKYIFIPAILSSIIAALYAWYFTTLISVPEAAGIGMSMFTGPLLTAEINGLESWTQIIIGAIIIPVIVTTLFYIPFKKFNKIKKNDLRL